MASNFLQNATDFAVNQLSLITSGGTEIDLRNIVVEISFFEDIFSTVMSGKLLITDGHDLVSSFGIHGNEFLRMDIGKPSLSGLSFQRMFRIYKISDRKPSTESDTGQTYVIHFCSQELITSQSYIVSKSYKNMKHKDMVLDICNNYLQIPGLDTSLFEDTSGLYSLIIPAMRPLEAINFICSRAYNGTSNYAYFFFETRQNYNFKSLQGMFKSPVYNEYLYDNKRVNPQPSADYKSINELRINNDCDVISLLSNGAYASKLLTIDVKKQKYFANTYSEVDKQKNGLLMNQYLPFNLFADNKKNALPDLNESYYRIVTTAGEDIDKYLMNRTMHMAIINTFKVTMVIPGDMFLSAGSMVKLNFPHFEYSGIGNKKFDNYRTGNFLVTAVHNKFTPVDSKHLTIVELAQDSFSQQLPEYAGRDLGAFRF